MKHCPVCRETCEPRLVEIYQEYRLLHCPLCNVVFSDPMRNPGGEYYQAYEGSELRKVFPESISWSHREFLLDLPAREGRLLDVGCGTGYFLSIVRQLGYEVTGIDFDKDAIDTGRRRYGLENIYPLSIEDAHRALQRRYDVVTFFEVLEHVDDPPRFLDHINALLKPGGYIVLSVPNRETPWWCDPLYRTTDNYPPYHLTRWSLSALEHFLDGHSFKILKARIKPLEAEELHRRWFSFGFMRMVGKKHYSATKREEKSIGLAIFPWIPLAWLLYKVKRRACEGMLSPLVPFCRMIGGKGCQIYVMAQSKL